MESGHSVPSDEVKRSSRRLYKWYCLKGFNSIPSNNVAVVARLQKYVPVETYLAWTGL